MYLITVGHIILFGLNYNSFWYKRAAWETMNACIRQRTYRFVGGVLKSMLIFGVITGHKLP